MPTLSSFISYGKALRKPKTFGIRRFEAPNSPHHPYASTDVVHITPTQSIQSYEEEELEAQLPFQSPPVTSPPPPEEDFLSPQLTPIRPSTPPKKLDVELPSDTMSDWIPSHLLDERMYNGGEPDQSPGAGSSKLSDERMVIQEDVVTRVDRVDEETPDEESVYTDEESYSSSTNDSHIVANLEAMDASSFVQTRDKLPPGAMLPFKKTAPTPIKIPNPSMHGPKVQVIRSSGGSKGPWHSGYTSSRPDSAHSGEDYSASAVSGTTLARALIGNSFVLSSDERASRYRSGGSVLTRTDSATLPRDENPFFYSPSYGNTPDHHSLVPLPSNADSVYIPPTNPRRLSDRPGEAKRKRQSTGSLLLRNDSEGETSLVRSNSTGAHPVSSPDQQSRRISRISEADSSNYSIPDHTASNPNDNEPLPSTSDSSYVPSPFLSPNPERLSNLSNVSSNRPPSTTSSGKEYDTMLDDYYSTAAPLTPNSPETAAGGLIPISMDAPHFRPPFSPISEESSSQLSPPTPYRRDSRRNTKGSGAGSPNGPRGTRAQQVRLLPIGESSQPNGHNSPEPESASSLIPPPVFSLFNRQRSGSAPNPIKIVRDSQDLTSYNLISTTRPVSSSSSPTSSPGHEYVKQTFPETPHAFSPMWSAGSMISPGMPGPTNRGSMDQILLAVPPTPLTATAEPMPALAQHMLARAASGARHSRQPSGTRVRTIPQQSIYSSMVPPPIPPDPEPAEEDEEESKRKRSYPSWVTQKFSTSDGEPSPSLKSDTHSPLDESVESSQSQPPLFQHYKEEDHNRQGSVGELSIKTEDALVNNSSQTSLTVRGLPALPPSPSVFGVSSFPSSNGSTVTAGLPQTGSSTSLLPAPSSQDPHTPLSGSVAASPRPLTPLQASQQTFSQHPDNTSPSTGSSAELEMSAPSIRSMGSPPPYYTLVFDQNHGLDNATPTSGESYRGAMSPNTPPSSRADSSRQSTSSIGGRRGRNRPPLPLGPRRPSHTANISQNGRQRNGSVSSINSNAAGGPSRLRSASSATPRSPRFQTPAPKWRGYTMDAAKWTFTSAQLQDIVSRAIRQSAEASAIRLLRLETVDKDLPAELHKMELQRTDIKTRYKMLSRRRTELLTILVSHTDGSKQEDPSAALRIINELRDVSVMLDRLAEDLHSVDEQVSQLTSLRDVHDASALAMAIRKLNASFLKQLAVSDALRSQVVALEAERDDAWQQAEKVANDFDRLSEKMEDVSPSNRSSRVMAMRKSSIRVSKAGLRSTRSSVSSINRLSTASISGIKSAFSIEDIPPVPPIPRPQLRPHRPVDILTDLPSTRSFITLSTDGNTPNSETRAMARAHEELCEMLGIGHDFRPRRAQSVIGQTRVHGNEDQPQTSIRSTRSSTSTGRPLSMPDRSGLTEVYQSMSADGNAMLATLGLLSDVE